MNTWILAEYKRLRNLGFTAQEALRAAKIKDEFEDLEDAGLVKFDVVPDQFVDPDNLVGDADEKQRKEILRLADRDGVWEIISFYRFSQDEEWNFAYQCAGFIGDDWKDSGYDVDARSQAIEDLKKEQEKRWSKEVEELANRATYAGV